MNQRNPGRPRGIVSFLDSITLTVEDHFSYFFVYSVRVI